jgi:hypothetical protein
VKRQAARKAKRKGCDAGHQELLQLRPPRTVINALFLFCFLQSIKQRSVDKYYLRLINATTRQRRCDGHLIATPAPRYYDAPRLALAINVAGDQDF